MTTEADVNESALREGDPAANFVDDLVISWEYLTVHVPESGWNCCSCKDSPIARCGHEFLSVPVMKTDPFYALASVSGYIRTGEILLVLGPDNTSKSTLLRALSGRLNKTDELSGTVALNGMPLTGFASPFRNSQSWRRLSGYVSASDSTHSPQLTVYETFEFAARCTSGGFFSEAKIKETVESMLETLGLSHVKDTVVGDENLRGVSGGQKRRVTVGEMAINLSARLFCMDNITDGLASTDSLKLISDIKRASRRRKVASVITLLQPSDEIVSLFDKLLVLTDTGEMSYFGPPDRAILQDVFLPASTTPFTGAISDLVMNQNMTSRINMTRSMIEEDAVKRYLRSTPYETLIHELADIRATAPPPQLRNLSALLPAEKYATSRGYQLRTIASRRIKLILRNAMTYSRVVIAILFGIIVGSLFSALNDDLVGALGRSGYLFLNCFLVLMLSAAVTIPENFRQRSTLFKLRSAEYFSGRVEYLTRVVLDMPLSLLEAVLMASISYYWAGMNPKPERFLFFVGVLIALECVGQALGRLLCAVIRSQVMANTMSSLIIFISAGASGYMPNYAYIPWVLRWLNWVTPVSYAYEAIIINEFQDEEVYGLSIVTGDGTTNIGTVAGNDIIVSASLPRLSRFEDDFHRAKIFDIFMLFFWAIMYDTLGMYLIERTRDWYHNQIRQPNATIQNKNKFFETTRDNEKVIDVDNDTDDKKPTDPDEWPCSLAVRDLKYRVSLGTKRRVSVHSLLGPCITKLSGNKQPEVDTTSKKEITLLNGVTARFERGKMTALMGQSGAGKTTLMDVIAGYKTSGVITGDILLHGRPKNDATWRRISGYAEQNDILNPYLSVRETLEFTAQCRFSSVASSDIDHVIRLMDLGDYEMMVVGREKDGEGLPKHARKRVTIANELVVKPKVLFLDEPTSGLGCNAAALVVGAVRRSTDAMGLITLATIHQPSRKMFEAFDDLLLLAKGGRVCWSGPMGPDSETVLNYFSSLSSTPPPETCNPADYVLDVVNKITGDVAVPAFSSSSQCTSVSSAIENDMKRSTNSLDGDAAAKLLPSQNENTRNIFREYGLLIKRHLLCEWRNPSYSFMRMIMCTISCLFLGLLFHGLNDDLQSAVFSIAAIFYIVFVLAIPMQAAVIPLIEDRAVLYRETVSGKYGRFSYGLGQLAANIPFHIINTCLMFVAFYFLVGFKIGDLHVVYFILMLFMANWVVMSMGQLYALVTPNEETANGLAGLSIILSVCLMGFLVTISVLPGGWIWAYWSNLFHYILQGLVTNQVSGSEYFLDIGAIIGDIENSDSNSSAVLFPGAIPEGNNTAAQALSFTGMALMTGEAGGINPFSNSSSLSNLVECLVDNNCLVEPYASNFITCAILSFPRPPPCKDQYDEVTSHINITEVTKCFIPDDTDVNSVDTGSYYSADGVPTSTTTGSVEDLPDSSQSELVTCLLKAVLPPDIKKAMKEISTTFEKLYDLGMIVIDIIENGIYIPGDAILFYFGWADFTKGGFEAPYKWHYSMTSVAVFLVAIEILKLIAIRFIVWTKR